jgi:cyclic beta-1,2-glucan synthetase
MNDSETIPGSQPPLTREMIEHLRATASWDVVHRAVGSGTFPARIYTVRRSLKHLERDLALLPPATAAPAGNSAALLELRANIRLLRSAVNPLPDQIREITKLPRVVLPAQRDEPRAAAVAALYLRAVGGEFSAPGFGNFVATLQAGEPLGLGELWSLNTFLKFVLLESLLDEARVLLRSTDHVPVSPISVGLKSLRTIGHTDWVSLIEPLILFDAALRRDPAQTYASMDFESRDKYRARVALIARHSDCTEMQVAQAALELAQRGGKDPADDPRMQRRQVHVGYYLIDKGFSQLAERTGYHAPPMERTRSFMRAHADDFYISGIQVITIVLIAVPILLLLSRFTLFDCLIAALVLLLPVMQCAVDLVNNSVTSILGADPLPKLDFSNGIPLEYSALVAVPSLLLNEKQVRALANDLEVRFLANRDPNLHFALLTDLRDAVSKPRTNDSDPLVELAIRLIDELNAKYASQKKGGFILLHRHRIFSIREGVWMGWERKRGKLLDLNKYLVGDYDAFPIKAGRLELLRDIRYVLTLDSDSQLPRGSAARLVGAIAHPLHQAVIDPKLRIVVAGYGILQPRIGVSVRSASRSRMAAIYSGQSGFDIYARAISDAYQDLYGEGIFTGKGIYEVATFHAVLDRRFPRNSLLSHDLIEGAYARAGLAADIELIDDYPSHLSAFNRRKHRWLRGDWQIAQWMFSRVPDESGRLVKNPISEVSRWKIFDNLRRSLVEPFTFILFLAGWLGLPGGPLYWTVVPLVLLIFPTIVQLSFGLSRATLGTGKGHVADAFSGFSKAILVALLNLAYLPHQALLSLDAIVRALVRRFITGQRLLEWETAAEAEVQSKSNTPADRYLIFTPIIAFATALLVYFVNTRQHHYALLVAAPVLVIWSVVPLITAWLNAPPAEQHKRLTSAGETFLLNHALRIWRYFHQFGTVRHNYLIPDNVEEDGLHEAARVSPTNVGLLLNARQAACELGFLTVPEFAILTERTLATIERLEKYRGHLYNWYDTQTLKPLDAAPFVSSVDSGNLVASLYTLRSGALALGRQPLLGPQLFAGLRAHWQFLRAQNSAHDPIAQLALPGPSAPVAAWIAWLSTVPSVFADSSESATSQSDHSWCLAEMQSRINAILALLHDDMPWLLPEYAPLRELPELTIKQDVYTLGPNDAVAFAEQLEVNLGHAWRKLIGNSQLLALGEQLRASLPSAAQNLRNLAGALRSIAQHAERLADATEFAFLADPGRKILSIGFDVRGQKLHEACYDMMASEARIGTFLAIARDEIPQQTWITLSRDHVYAFGEFVLLSWTGTMFEYLMPALWMRSYPDTLISRTLGACVRVQRSFASSQGIPWGISESGTAKKDDAGHYGYKAFGVPKIALSIDATAGPVVSPYSTFLALGVDSLAAVRNLRHFESSGWVGAYGFYEAGDYTSPGKPILVREWMAHHQGMSLLAILNLLHDNVVQRWFHENPVVQSTELLLHEMPVSKGVLRANLEE